MKVNKLPIKGYANVYKHIRKDVLGRIHTEYHFGKVCATKEFLPQHYEYDCVAYKHIGVAKVKITMEE